MIKTLLPIISKIEHKVYCEPFCRRSSNCCKTTII